MFNEKAKNLIEGYNELTSFIDELRIAKYKKSRLNRRLNNFIGFMQSYSESRGAEFDLAGTDDDFIGELSATLDAIREAEKLDQFQTTDFPLDLINVK